MSEYLGMFKKQKRGHCGWNAVNNEERSADRVDDKVIKRGQMIQGLLGPGSWTWWGYFMRWEMLAKPSSGEV